MRTVCSIEDEKKLIIGVLARGPLPLHQYLNGVEGGIKNSPTLASIRRDPNVAAGVIRQNSTRGPNPRVIRLKPDKPGGECIFILNPENPDVLEAVANNRIDKGLVGKWREIIATSEPIPKIDDGPVSTFQLKGAEVLAVLPPMSPAKAKNPDGSIREAKHIEFYSDLRNLLLALHMHAEIGWWERELFPVHLLAQLAAMLQPEKKVRYFIEQYREDRVIKYAFTGQPVRGDQWNVYEISHAERYANRYTLFRQPDLKAGNKLLARMLDSNPPFITLEELLNAKAEVNSRLTAAEPPRAPTMQVEVSVESVAQVEQSPVEAEEMSTTNSTTDNSMVAEPIPKFEPTSEAAPPVDESVPTVGKYQLDSLSDDDLENMLKRVKRELEHRKRAHRQRLLDQASTKVAVAKANLTAAVAESEKADNAVRVAQKALIAIENEQRTLLKKLNS